MRPLRPQYWILDEDGEPRAIDDVLTWATWFEDPTHRIVLQERRGHTSVSTVFLGLDHDHWFADDDDASDPVLWETMIFGGPFHDYQRRYRSRLAALIGHADAVRLVDLWRTAPRRLKKTLQKYAQTVHGDPTTRWRPGDLRRLTAAWRQIGRDPP